MADNRAQYGFRWYRALNGGKAMPAPEKMIVATGTSFDVSGGASNVELRVGDPVIKLSTGGVTLCNGAENGATVVGPYGIVVGVGPYWDGSKMVWKKSLPSDISWGTNLARQSTVHVVPVTAGIWEIDCDDATSATTEAAYQAFIGENADFVLAGASGATYATPRLDISTHATTGSLVWRIVGVSPTAMNQDFSGNYVKLLVRANLAQDPAYALSAAAATANATTGV